jgi:hypothetical protein
MNARKSENYLAISRSSSASKSVEIYREDFFLGPNVVSLNRAVVPYEISKVNCCVEAKILVSMSEEIAFMAVPVSYYASSLWYKMYT